MHLTRRDYAVVGALVIALVFLGGVLSLRPRTIPQVAIAEATASPTLPPPVVYREGVVGTPDVDHAAVGTQPRRALARRPRVQRARCGWAPEHPRAGPRLVVQAVRRRQDVDVPHPRRRGVAGRRARHLGRRPVHGRGAQGPRRVGRPLRLVGRGRDRARSTTRPSRSASRRRSAASSPRPPSRCCRRTSSARPRTPTSPTSEFAKAPVGSGPYGLAELDETKAVLVPAQQLLPPIETPAPRDHRLARLARHARSATLVARPHAVHRARSSCSFFADDAAAAAAVETRRHRRRCRPRARGRRRRSARCRASSASATRRRRCPRCCSTSARTIRSCATCGSARALLAAIDREGLVRDVLGGDGSVADALVPPTSWAYDGEAARVDRVRPERRGRSRSRPPAGSKIDGAWAAPAGQGALRAPAAQRSRHGEPAARGDRRRPSATPGPSSGSR